MPNWAEQVTAIATAVGAVGLLSTVGLAVVLYRELDYFEQLGALEQVGAVNFDLLQLLLGRRLIERWDMWKPSIDAMGPNVYPMFEALVAKMRTALNRS